MVTADELSMTEATSGFTMPEYRQFVQKYQHTLRQYWKQPLRAREQRDTIEKKLDRLRKEYLARLPVYLLARCPFCGGEVHDVVDTYSLNGLVIHGWAAGSNGVGWWGHEVLHPRCEHTRIVAYCVSLNGLIPDDVFCYVRLGPAVPYVMWEPLKAPDSAVVLHSLPVGRFDDDTPRHRYTAYFMTYFVRSEETFLEAIQEWREDPDPTLVYYDDIDFDLRSYIEQGQLYWLDLDDPDLPLRNRPVEACPYLDLPGSRNPWRGIHGDTLSYTLRRVRGWWQRLKR